MNAIIARPWNDTTAPWSEDDLQMAIVQTLRREGILFAADQNAGKRNLRDGAKRKALGMTAGEPDLRLYLPGGRVAHIEVKAAKGALSPAQRDRHAQLAALGHTVHVLKATTPAEAVAKTVDILARLND